MLWPVVQISVEHWGDTLQFYPNFALFSTLGGMNLDQDFFQVSKLSEDQKKGLRQKWNTCFSRIYSDAHQSQIIGGNADEDHTQIVGGYTVKSLKGIYSPHPPLVSAPLTVA